MAMKKVAVVGMGIFGTALALTAVRAGNKVLGWARQQEVVDDINQKHISPKYLPNIPLRHFQFYYHRNCNTLCLLYHQANIAEL